MATYSFLNKKTGRRYEKVMTMAEAEAHAKDPNVEWLCSAPPIGDPIRLGMRKPDDGFRDILREVKKKHNPRRIKNTVNTF